jgi:outer membrane protein TolC
MSAGHRGAGYLPDLGLNVTYGIDAPQYAVNGPDKMHNLAYSATVTLDIPVWDWLAAEHKVNQSDIRRDAAQIGRTRRLDIRVAHTQSY